uniref:Uncharacterized protein n=1 Tax=Glossina brevipalpis TaxID=37001 RepID=A0A1A9W821_9MUSC
MESKDTNRSSNAKFPVSLEFFKKHIHYEELVDVILKDGCRGDDEKFKEVMTCESKRENCIRNYYKYFYTKPRIRERWPFKLKAMPSCVRVKILEIPKKEKNNAKNNADERNQNIRPSTIDYASPQVKRLKLSSNIVCEEDNLHGDANYQPKYGLHVEEGQEEECLKETNNQTRSQKIPPQRTYTTDSSNRNINSALNSEQRKIVNSLDINNYFESNVKQYNNKRKSRIQILDNRILVPAKPDSFPLTNTSKENRQESLYFHYLGLNQQQTNLEMAKNRQSDTTAQITHFSDSNMIQLSPSTDNTAEGFAKLKESSDISEALKKSLMCDKEENSSQKRLEEAKSLLFCNVHKHDEWIYQVPVIKEEIMQGLRLSKEFSQSASPTQSAAISQSTDEDCCAIESDDRTKYTTQTQNISDGVFVMVPNTKPQISMLPDDLSIDENLPVGTPFQGQQGPIISSTEGNVDSSPIVMGVLTKTKIKSEPCQMLNGLQFYIDTDDDDVIHCSLINHDPILLNDTEVDLNCGADILENVKHSRNLSCSPDTCETRNNLTNLSILNVNNKITISTPLTLPDVPLVENSKVSANVIQNFQVEVDNRPENSKADNTKEHNTIAHKAITSQKKQKANTSERKQRKIRNILNTLKWHAEHKNLSASMQVSLQSQRDKCLSTINHAPQLKAGCSNAIFKEDDLSSNANYQPDCDVHVEGNKEEHLKQNSEQSVSQEMSPEEIYTLDNLNQNRNSGRDFEERERCNGMDTNGSFQKCTRNLKQYSNKRKNRVQILDNRILVPAEPYSVPMTNIFEKNHQEESMLNQQMVKSKQSDTTAQTTYFSGIFTDEFLLHYISQKRQNAATQQHILKLIKQKFPHLTDSNENQLCPSIGNIKEDFAKPKALEESLMYDTEENSIQKRLEEAKKLLFCNVHKTHTLSYILRTRHGLKEQVVRILLGITLEEFRSLVHIYEADELKNDPLLMDRLYQYATKDMKIWPINLFIKLEDLFNFLIQKNINFKIIDQNFLLENISPKFSHWSELQSKTNFLDCVRETYLKQNALELDVNDAVAVEAECKNHYNRCWKHDEWIYQVPVIKEETVQGLRLSEKISQPASPTHSTDKDRFATENDDHSKYTKQTQSFSDIAFVMMPNTQEQINLLPDELSVDENLSVGAFFQDQQDPIIPSNGGNIDTSGCLNTPIVTGVLTETKIKSEPCQMLKDLQFCIDTDDDDVIHCTLINNEPILIDDTEIDLNCSAGILENVQHSTDLSCSPNTCEARDNLPNLSILNVNNKTTSLTSFTLPDIPVLENSKASANGIQLVQAEPDNGPENSNADNARERNIVEYNAITSQRKQKKTKDIGNTLKRCAEHNDLVSSMHDYLQLQRISGCQLPNVVDNYNLNEAQPDGQQLISISKVLQPQVAMRVLSSSKVNIGRKITVHKDEIKQTTFVPQLRHKFPPLVVIKSVTNLQVPQELVTAKKNTSTCDSINSIFASNSKLQPNQVIFGNINCTKSCESNSVSVSKRFIPMQLISKSMLHRTLCDIDYFQSITSNDIAQYQLPTIINNSTYLQALIICDGIRIRLCNKSLSALFPQWSSSLKQDLFTVLRDLKEYHYSLSNVLKEKSSDDIRIHVLDCLFKTAPSFSFGYLSYELGNPEFGYCYAITNNNNRSYKRMPHANLTQGLKPSMVAKILEFKRNF